MCRMDPAEPKMPWSFSWIVDNRLAGMAFPDGDSNLIFLVNHGIFHIISLIDYQVPYTEHFPEIEVLGLKVEEFTPPTLEQINQCLDFIDTHNKRNQAVVVHCEYGRGRTGTVFACYLVKAFGLGADEAIAKLREMRPGSVETRKQEDMVRRFARTLVHSP